LKRHSQSHENKREFKCKVCGKGFNTSSILNTHKRLVHQIVKDFECPECEKSFETKLEVMRHLISHSQIKEFACPECGKLFKRNYNEVRRHLIIHTDKKDSKNDTTKTRL
jgi:KRAB domain-containing zinc finger protein